METTRVLTPAPGKSDQSRARLLEAALHFFGTKGPEGATLREIAQAAGQNVAAIGYYFGGKDNLYRAVLESVVEEIKRRLADVMEQIAAFRAQPEHPKEEALRLLKLFLRSVYLRLLSRDNTLPLARLIVREQMQATTGFEILYEQGFRRLHEALCFLVGTALGTDPRDTETILRTHAFMGQIYFFAMSRKAILRRVGWKSLEGKNAEQVADIVGANLDVLAAGFAVRATRRKK